MLASIVIRTLNEAEHLDDLLTMIDRQESDALTWEVILVDSGSTDGTVEIASRHGCRITEINREEFSFGRSLNRGCEVSSGEILVFISGHCVPAGRDWLQRLCAPLLKKRVAYTYGRQIGDDDSNFSERCIFAKYYPAESAVPQEGFYCNNANSALLRTAWETFRFDEELTGLEDMELAKRLVAKGYQIGYVAEAPVFHHHNETWTSVRRRFEREAIALQKIMPEVQLSVLDLWRYVITSIGMDWRSAVRNGQLRKSWLGIILYRLNQYIGSYKGNHEHRKLSHKQKEHFFYPYSSREMEDDNSLQPLRRSAPHGSDGKGNCDP